MRALYSAQKKNKRLLAVFFKRELASDTKDKNIKTHNKNITVVEFKWSFFLLRVCKIFRVQWTVRHTNFASDLKYTCLQA